MQNSSRESGLKPQARAVLAMLRKHPERGVSNGDFIRAYIERFGGRLHELRKAGWSIETVREGQGRSRYFLRAEPAGLRAGASPPPSAEPGGNPPARPTTALVAVMGGTPCRSGGDEGALFDGTAFERRGYADPEDVAA